MPAILSRVSLLVDTAGLAECLDEHGLAVVDIRGSIKPPTAPPPHYGAKHDAYREAHIPGAVFVDRCPTTRGPGMSGNRIPPIPSRRDRQP